MPDVQVTKFLDDFGDASDDVLRALNGEAELVEVWKGVSEAVKVSRKSIKFLKKIKEFQNPVNKRFFDFHVFYDFKQSLAGSSSFTQQELDFFKSTLKNKVGCHKPNAVDGQYVRYLGTPSTPNAHGVTKCNIEINVPKYTAQSPDIPTNWVWEPKTFNNPNDYQSFFPANMTKEQIIEQVCSALVNPSFQTVPGYSRMFYSSSENGMVIRWFEDSAKPMGLGSFFPEY